MFAEFVATGAVIILSTVGIFAAIESVADFLKGLA